MKDFFLTVEGPYPDVHAPQGPIATGTSFHCTPNEAPYEYTGAWDTESGTKVFGQGVANNGWYEWKKDQHRLDLTRPNPNSKEISLMRFFGVKNPIETNQEKMDQGMYWVPTLPVEKPKQPVAYNIFWS